MKKWLKTLFRRHNPFSPLINVYISTSALIHNLHSCQKLAENRKIAPVLKSNAYGHGLLLVAQCLKNEKVPFFVIDSHFEARALRNEGIHTPLLIIGYSTIDSILANNLKDIFFTITSLDALKELGEKITRKIKIHLKIDTGMHRQGISIDEVDEAFDIIKNSTFISMEGICSHFSDADNADSKYTDGQIEIWNKIVDKTRDHFPSLLYWHISNTAGQRYDQAKANIIRLGIGLYLGQKPALTMETIISGIRKIKKGDMVGYNKTFTADRDMTIATISVGYYEGIDRRLSNKGFIKIGNAFCPIIGRVSMNITTIDISNISEVKINDKVIVISDKPEDRNSIRNMAEICETIPYEIAIHIPAHLKRTLVD